MYGRMEAVALGNNSEKTDGPSAPLGVKGRGSQVWQGKDLQECIFGSVAMIRVTGDFSEVWQAKDLVTGES